MRFARCAAFCLYAIAASAARADSLTYTETVTASGSLNNVAFTNQLVTLTAVADPSTVTGSGGFFGTPLLTLTGSVGTLGSFFVNDALVFANNGDSEAGFGTNGYTILSTYRSAPLSSYDLKSVVGPASGGPFSSVVSYATTTGTLRLAAFSSNATFQATNTSVSVTPEPSSLALLGTGLLGVVGVMRRRMII